MCLFHEVWSEVEDLLPPADQGSVCLDVKVWWEHPPAHVLFHETLGVE